MLIVSADPQLPWPPSGRKSTQPTCPEFQSHLTTSVLRGFERLGGHLVVECLSASANPTGPGPAELAVRTPGRARVGLLKVAEQVGLGERGWRHRFDPGPTPAFPQGATDQPISMGSRALSAALRLASALRLPFRSSRRAGRCRLGWIAAP